jgi:hypothetical protein
MSDTPKFTVIDRRKFHAAEEEQEANKASEQQSGHVSKPVAPAEPEAPSAGPQLVVTEPKPTSEQAEAAEAEPEAPEGLPPAPTADEAREQKMAYDVAAQRLEDIVRAQNPAMGAQPPVGFENLVQQIYVSAMIQMGAGTQEGQRPRVDILGARQTIDLLGVLAEKTKGNLSEAEDRALQTVLFEVRMAFMELTSMITVQGIQPPPPPQGIR